MPFWRGAGAEGVVSDEQLLRTWKAWDAKPESTDRSSAFEDACQTWASSPNRLRALLAAARRGELSYEAALDLPEVRALRTVKEAS